MPLRHRFAVLAAVLVPGLLLGPTPARPAPGSSMRGPGTAAQGTAVCPGSDLYCIELRPATGISGVSGRAELARVPTPFGVAVTPDGRHVHEIVLDLQGLPDPGSLGDFTAYVAWVTTPWLDPMVKLGPAANGRHSLGRVALNQFIVMVTAETRADVQERRGRLVLRGLSASNRMEAHDLMTLAPSAVFPGTGGPGGGAGGPGPGAGDPATGGAAAAGGGPTGAAGGGETGDHAAAGHAAAGGDTWGHPPMHPAVPMLPGMAGLVPSVAPLLPDGTGVDDIPVAIPRQVVRLGDGGTLDLEAGLVRRTVGRHELVMLGFNGQYPGPLLHVPEEATIFVSFTNRTGLPTAIHWHGIRLDNRFDGVPGVTQDPVLPGETFRYTIHFPDPGIYWYHPHHREDVQQEMGLYGNLLVESPREDFFDPANRQEVLMLDDLLVGEEGLVPFGDEGSNYALMGRFGNVLLVNGEPRYELAVQRGEVVRFLFTNVSNTRTFNLSLVPAEAMEADDETLEADVPTLPVKVVAGDIGRFERQEWAGSVVIAPAERYVVDARFPEAGRFLLVNRVQAINHRYGNFFPESAVMGTVRVGDEPAAEDHAATFETLRDHPDVTADIDRVREHFDGPPDRELVLTLEARDLPAVVEQVMQLDRNYFNPVEWSGTMPMMNWISSTREVRWVLRDEVTGAENDAIDWRFEVGDVVKIRVHNDREAFHAMQHPLHIHGQRFLVLEQNGVATDNLVWKDTVLLPVGSTTDLLLEVSNPGRWMVHCHIAEHLESGMKFVFEAVERSAR